MKKITVSFVCLTFTLATIIQSCKKDDCGNCIDEKPRAYVGQDQHILLQMDCILDGNLSYDRNGSIAAYKWTVLSGPFGATIDNANAVQTFARFSQTGMYQFELKVTNKDGISATDTLQVRVDNIDSELICNRPIISARLVPIGRLPEPRSNMKAIAAGNKLVFAGGDANKTSGTLSIYDVTTNAWTSAALTDETLRWDVAVTSLGNKIFFAGGWDSWNGFHTSAVDIYDAETNSWSTANLSEARMGIAAVASGNTIVFAGGGIYDEDWGFRAVDVVDIFNSTTNTWTKEKLSEGRMYMTAASSGNEFYFAGGTTTIYSASEKIDIYNSISGSWSQLKLKIPRSRMESIVHQGTLFLAGGYEFDGTNDGGKHVEIIDLTTGASSVECMIAKIGHTAIKSGDNLIFFTGYTEKIDLRNGSVFEIYNTKTKEWSVGILNRAFYRAGIVSLNNTIYVAGGIDASGKTSDMLWKLEF